MKDDLDPYLIEDGEVARIQVAETNLPADDLGFPMPGSSIVRQKKCGTAHLVKEEGIEDQWLDSVRLYCGRRSSEATHERVLGPVWPRRLMPRCSDCFYSRLKRRWSGAVLGMSMLQKE